MTTQPPIPPAAGVFDSPDSPPSADSADTTQDGVLIIQDTEVIDATKASTDYVSSEGEPESQQ